MTHELPPLPYNNTALEPHISRETLDYHYGKHHQAYVTNLNKLIANTEHAKKTLEELILTTTGGIFNNAAQVWNHTFYWNSLSPNGGGEAKGELLNAINKKFGSYQVFKDQFSQAAAGHFGSGWAWLVKDNHGELQIYSTPNAENPLQKNHQPLLTCDVWEHAYYIDTRNSRPLYIENFWKIVNWDFAAKNFAASPK